ncbi:hypothetical protein ACFLXX_05630 [Chloroflexota bacterium]
MVDRNAYANWLTSEIGFEMSYHNHKETMAWLITALYVPAVLYLGYTEGTVWRGMCWERVVIGLITFAACLVWLFVNTQYRLRWEAADAVKILMQRLADLNGGGELPKQCEWKPKEDDHWPHFIRCKLDILKEDRKFWKHPSKFLADNRGRTEFVSHTAIILVSLFAVILAWS